MQDVFEPTANFDGEVFEPMNFDGEYSNFFKLFNKTPKTPEQLATEKANADAKSKLKADVKLNKKPIDWSKVGTGLGGVVKTASDTLTQLAPIMQKPEFQKNLESVCGKSGVVLGIGKPRTSYLECAERYMKSQGVNNAQFDEWKNNLNQDNTDPNPTSTGMSMGAKIGIGVGILAVVGVAVYFIVKGGKKGAEIVK